MKKTTIAKILLIFVVMFLATAVIAHAEETTSTDDAQTKEIKGEALQVRYDHLNCKVTFTNTQIDLVKQYLNVDLTADKDKLIADMAALKSLLDAKNKTAFDAYVQDPIKPDFQKATADLNGVKSDLKKYNLTNETRTALKDGIKNAKDAYAKCVSDKEEKMGKVMEKHMNQIRSRWGTVLGKMEKRQINTTELEAISAEMQLKLDELQAAIATGNQTLIKQKMQEMRQQYLHLFARFEIAKLNGYADKLGPKANQYGINIDDARLKLQEAARLTEPGRMYDEGDFRQVWQDIRGAGSDIRDAAKDTIRARIDERTRTESGETNGSGTQNGEVGGNH